MPTSPAASAGPSDGRHVQPGNGSDEPAPQARGRSGGRLVRRLLPDLFGLVWVVVAAGAVLAPALARGEYLGSYDWLSRFGLSASFGVVVHNHQRFDLITEFVPWTQLAWTQVHQGHLPLWNPDTVLGTPLAFNWQAGTFGLPALVGYLFPLRLAYTVQIVTTLLIAGTGTYLLGRVMGLGVVAAALGGTVYELSGALMAWLGSPITGVMAWAGWLFVALYLVVRGRRPLASVALLAVVVAFAVYTGQPDTLVNLGSAALVFLAGLLVVRARRFGGSGPVLRPLARAAAGIGIGAGLSAPLLLPGLQVLPSSVRAGKNLSQALPPGSVLRTLFQGFDGLPVAGSHYFGSGYYTKTATYVGVLCLALAAVAVACAVRDRWRRPEVIAVGAVAAVMAAIVYVPVVESALDGLPGVGDVQWRRSTTAMGFGLAMLGALGLDALVRGWHRRAVRRRAGWALAGTALALLAVWLFGRGQLSATDAHIREHSFVWPALSVAVGVAVLGGLSLAARRRRPRARGGRHPAPHAAAADGGGRAGGARRFAGTAAGLVLLACESAFLVSAGGPLMPSSPTYVTPTPAEAKLARMVGPALVGFGANTCFAENQLGIIPDYNVALGVKELAAYEPLLPAAYGNAWRADTGQPATAVPNSLLPFAVFCPAVTTVATARLFGVGYILDYESSPPIGGAILQGIVGNEAIYKVPGAAQATLTPAPSARALPPMHAPGTAVPVSQPDSATWRLVTDASTPQVLRLRLSDSPGWHASIDGRPLALTRFAGIMLQARIPPGRHLVVLRYWPETFSAGLGLAGLAVLGLVGAAMVASVRRRRRRGRRHSPRHSVRRSTRRSGTGPRQVDPGRVGSVRA